MAIITRGSKMLPDLHPVVSSQVDDMELEDKVNYPILAKFEKMGALEEKIAEVEQPSKSRSSIDEEHGKIKKVEESLTRIPRPPPLFLHRLKKKVEKGKFNKFCYVKAVFGECALV